MKIFPFWVGLRYTRSSNQQKFLSLLSWLSLIGMMLGVAALIIVMSVMKGFQAELQQRLLSVSAEVVLETSQPSGFNAGIFTDIIAPLKSQYPQLETQQFIGGDVVLQFADQAKAVKLTGLPTDAITELLLANAQTPQPALGRYSIIIGDVLARRLAAEMGDRVKIILPQLQITPFSTKPRQREFIVAGIFSSGSDIDANSAFVPLDAARRLYRLKPGFVHGVEIFSVMASGSINAQTIVFAGQLQQRIDELNLDELTAKPWQAKQQQLYRAIKMEQFMIGFMLSLVIAVAAFNLIALLSMMVASKQSDIAVLQMMGMSSSHAMLIFLTQGMFLAIVSTLIGVLSGVIVALNISNIVAWLESQLGVYLFDPAVFYITGLPSHLQYSDVIYVTCFTLLLSVIFCLYPAWRASKITPVDALSYH